jgi:tRNA(Ile)-lysidine synthase
LVAVGDLWVCEGWEAAKGERGLKIHWQVNSL